MITINTFSFSLSPLTKAKEKLKAYKSLESYNQFASRWIKEVKNKILWSNHLDY